MGPMKRASKTALLAAALLTSASASAFDVKGSVRSSEEAKHNPIDGVRTPYFLEWNGFIEPKKASVDFPREVAVVLIGSEGSKDATTALLKDGALAPNTIVMQAGTSLRLRNDDDFAHRLYAEGLKAFDPIETASGGARQIQLDQVGSFPVLDKLAPHIKGHLHVLPRVSAVAAPEGDGTFTFRDVPAGGYTLKVFRGASELAAKQLQVAEDAREITLDPIDIKAGK